MKKVYDSPAIGEKFNSWTVISEPFTLYRVHRGVRCRCECGTEKDVMIRYLHLGMSKSCGKCNQIVPAIGSIYGRWTVVGKPVHIDWKMNIPCKCSCGKEKMVAVLNLIKGKSTSCGCFRSEEIAKRQTTHGDTHNRLYWIWQNMKHRCYKKYNSGYSHYGARGISVCEEWMNSYPAFKQWALAHGYSDDLVCDRKDTYGNYEPSNCRWITQKENCRNSRSNHLLTAFGETKCAKEWFEDSRCVVQYQTLIARLNRGWNPLKALTLPV